MTRDSLSDRYPAGARAFHWGMAALVTASWGLGAFSVYLRGDLSRGTTVALHKAVATTVIAAVAARLVYRWVRRRHYPALPAGTGRALRAAAQATHLLLYAVAMIAAPLTGWYWSSVAGKPVRMLGLIPLPPIAAADPALYATARAIHVATVWAAAALIALHLLAVAKHALVDRDAVLRRMTAR